MYDICFQYGSVNGCDCKCPKFVGGECELCQEDITVFKKIIDDKDLTDDDKLELCYKYGYVLAKICYRKVYNWKENI